MKHYCFFKSPIGTLLLIGKNQVLEQLHFPNKVEGVVLDQSYQQTDELFSEIIRQLTEYFNGDRQKFELNLAPRGTVFQQRIWEELQRIEYGMTCSYGEIAERIGNPKACRAVGMANGRNPIPIIIPCHRIIGKDGSLTGFGGGLEVKQRLLELEGIHLP